MALSANRPRSRTDSRNVPEPKTWDLGSPESSWAIEVRISTGFDTTRTIVLDLKGVIAFITVLNTEMLRCMSWMAVSPVVDNLIVSYRNEAPSPP